MLVLIPMEEFNLSGRWVLDQQHSDSVRELMKYHSLLTPKLEALLDSIVTTLVIDHTPQQFRTTVLSTLNGKQLEPTRDSYDIDQLYHPKKMAWGETAVRCWQSDHGFSLVVDAKCKKDSDIERTERSDMKFICVFLIPSSDISLMKGGL